MRGARCQITHAARLVTDVARHVRSTLVLRPFQLAAAELVGGVGETGSLEFAVYQNTLNTLRGQ